VLQAAGLGTRSERRIAEGLRCRLSRGRATNGTTPMQENRSTPSFQTLRALPRRTQLLIVFVAALVVIAVFRLGSMGAQLFAKSAESSSRPASPAGAFRPTPEQMASLTIATVSTMKFRTERITDGKIAINAEKTTPVFSPYSGRVAKIIANQGDYVRRGAALLAVEATEFVQGQNDLISAAAAVNTARSQVAMAQTNEQRKHALYEAKAGALQDWQQSQTELITAQNNLRSAQTTLALVRNRLRILGMTDAEIDALEDAQRINPVAYVQAPISGRVIDRQVGRGQYIQAGGTTPVYSIGDLSTVWLVANVREPDAPLMRLGEPVEVHVLALPGRVFKAKLTYVASAIDPNTHRLAVRAEVENLDGLLKPEMFASFSIFTDQETAAPGVPEDAIVHEGSEARVWVVQKDGSIVSRPIVTGRAANGLVEVLSGLTEGERIVTSGALFIDRAAKRD